MASRPAWWMRPWAVTSVVWLVPALFNVINVIGQRRLAGRPAPSFAELVWSGGDWLVYAVLTPIVFDVTRRWPISRPVVTNRVLLHVWFALLFCVAWATSGKLLEVALAFGAGGRETALAHAVAGTGPWSDAGWDWLSWVLTTLPFGCVVYFSLAGIAHAIRYFTESNDRELQLAKLAEQLSGARFAALQAQVNPHFLFNTLNTIAVLVRDNDRVGAVRIVEQFSDVLRRTLSRHTSSEVALEDELELVRQYVAIEQARFSDRLRPTFTVDSDVVRAAVPSFAIQHLVENAIRHGVARREDAGRVDVTARRDAAALVVTVQDDGHGLAPDKPPGAGHGLANTRERLTALYGAAASLDVRATDGVGVTATLRVPLRLLPLPVEVADDH